MIGEYGTNNVGIKYIYPVPELLVRKLLREVFSLYTYRTGSFSPIDSTDVPAATSSAKQSGGTLALSSCRPGQCHEIGEFSTNSTEQRK